MKLPQPRSRHDCQGDTAERLQQPFGSGLSGAAFGIAYKQTCQFFVLFGQTPTGHPSETPLLEQRPPSLQLTASQGARRVVVLSAITVQDRSGYQRFSDAFQAVEDAAKASGLQWTILRCADFAVNALAWAQQIRLAGVVRGVYGDGATATIHERDVAAVSTRVLVDARHTGHTYVLTGPQSLTQRAKVRLIGESIGRDMPWMEVAPEQFRQAMLAQGLPEDVPDRMIGYWSDYVQQSGPSSDTVEQILGRPALTFAEWAAEYTAAFRN